MAELTRLGMGKGEMKEVAEIIHLGMAGQDRRAVLARVKELRKGFQTVKYAFRESPAYFFR